MESNQNPFIPKKYAVAILVIVVGFMLFWLIRWVANIKFGGPF